MKTRQEKPTDQDKVKQAYQYLIELLQQREEEIEPSLWIGAMICILADTFEASGISFEQFKKQINNGMDFYKY